MLWITQALIFNVLESFRTFAANFHQLNQRLRRLLVREMWLSRPSSVAPPSVKGGIRVRQAWLLSGMCG
jgi:hypothetical protein